MHLNLRVVTPENMQAFSASKSQQNNVVYFYKQSRPEVKVFFHSESDVHVLHVLYVNAQTKVAIFPNFNTLFVAMMTHGYTCMQ